MPEKLYNNNNKFLWEPYSEWYDYIILANSQKAFVIETYKDYFIALCDISFEDISNIQQIMPT